LEDDPGKRLQLQKSKSIGLGNDTDLPIDASIADDFGRTTGESIAWAGTRHGVGGSAAVVGVGSSSALPAKLFFPLPMRLSLSHPAMCQAASVTLGSAQASAPATETPPALPYRRSRSFDNNDDDGGDDNHNRASSSKRLKTSDTTWWFTAGDGDRAAFLPPSPYCGNTCEEEENCDVVRIDDGGDQQVRGFFPPRGSPSRGNL
jgi:hypothetical protein